MYGEITAMRLALDKFRAASQAKDPADTGTPAY